MDPIDVLDRRITAMENVIFGNQNPENCESDKNKPITESLMHVNSLIQSALSGREAITSTMTRLCELNECLDPSYEDNVLSVDAKLQYIFAMEPEVQKTVDHLREMQKMVSTLDSLAIQRIPDHTLQLQGLSTSHLEMKQQNDEVTEDIFKSIHTYNEIINSITRNFSRLESLVTKQEIATQTKDSQ